MAQQQGGKKRRRNKKSKRILRSVKAKSQKNRKSRATRRNRVSRRINGGGRFGDLLRRHNAKVQECHKKCDEGSKPDPMHTYVTSAKATPNGWYMDFSGPFQEYPEIFTLRHDGLPTFRVSDYGDRNFSEYLENIEELPSPLKTYGVRDKIFKLGSDTKNLYWEDQFEKARYPFNPSSPLKIGDYEDIATIV